MSEDATTLVANRGFVSASSCLCLPLLDSGLNCNLEHHDQSLSSRVLGCFRRQCPTSSQGQPLFYWKTVHQTLELLLAQFDFVLEFALLDDERRLHLDKVLIVCEVVLLQVAGQDVINNAFPTVQVLLQLLRVLMLSYQQLPLLN